jgi:hypothetical protein
MHQAAPLGPKAMQRWLQAAPLGPKAMQRWLQAATLGLQAATLGTNTMQRWLQAAPLGTNTMQRWLQAAVLAFFLLLSPLNILAQAEVASAQAAPVLKIEKTTALAAILAELEKPGSRPELYLLAEKFRLDLSLYDLIDQTAPLTRESPELHERLREALAANQLMLPEPQKGQVPAAPPFVDFRAWFEILREAARENPALRKSLDRALHFQRYSWSGAAFPDESLSKGFRSGEERQLLAQISRYNRFATDPEGERLLRLFETETRKNPLPPFYTAPLTVAKLETLLQTRRNSRLQALRRHRYQELLRLHSNEDPRSDFLVTSRALQVIGTREASRRAVRLFNQLQKLPEKNQILALLDRKLPGLGIRKQVAAPPSGGEEPRLPGGPTELVVTPKLLDAHFDALTTILGELALEKILRSDDDAYLLSVRKYLKQNSAQLRAELGPLNAERERQGLQPLVLALPSEPAQRAKKPSRLAALASLEALIALRPDAPWLEGPRPVLIRHNGKPLVFHADAKAAVGNFFLVLGKTLLQPETSLSVLAGTAVFALTEGNFVAATTTRRLVKKAIETQRYDREWKEFAREAPAEVLQALLTGSGFAPGRFAKVIALGASQGLTQSLLTGQDPTHGAAVGAGIKVLETYLLPPGFSRPMRAGIDAHSLKLNRRLEILEKSIRGAIHGTAVAALDQEPLALGAAKGAGFGALSAQLQIWFLGTRYAPYREFAPEEVDWAIRAENRFQNEFGRGGPYRIDQQLIEDATWREGGKLPKLIKASITLPGNIAMSELHKNDLLTLTHEASHLMQQEQSGVFGFYLFRYLPAAIRHGYEGHPDENDLSDFPRLLREYQADPP